MKINQIKKLVLSLSLVALWFVSTAAFAQNTADNAGSTQNTQTNDKAKPADASEQKEVITQEPGPA